MDKVVPESVEIEKRSGWDWDVTFLDNGEDGDGAVIECRIFGIMTIKQLLDQAYADSGMPEDSEIISIVRVPLSRDDGPNIETEPSPPTSGETLMLLR